MFIDNSQIHYTLYRTNIMSYLGVLNKKAIFVADNMYDIENKYDANLNICDWFSQNTENNNKTV